MKRRKKRLTRKWPVRVCIGIFGIICAGLSIFLYVKITEPSSLAEEQKTEDTMYPTQYSDTHITKNAIATDDRFKDVVIIKKENFLANAISSLQTGKPIINTSGPEKGTWLWTPTLDLTPEYWNPIFAESKRNNINTIYLSIDSYLDIFVMPEGPEKESKKKAFNDILNNFITTAHKNNIEVDAEAGWRNWAESGNEYKASAIIDFVLEFNASHTEKFRGFQYDIEPYLIDSYAKNKADTLRNFINLVNETVTRLENSELKFAVVIPDFYDGDSKETPRFFYGLRYGYTLNHLIKVLDRRPGSTLIIMAYRNYSKGIGGSIEISEDEIKTADEYNTKVIVAQETGEISPSYITFHNTSLANLNTQIQNIEKAFADNESYNGIAIHYINALMQLK